MMRIHAADGPLPFHKLTILSPELLGSSLMNGTESWAASHTTGQYTYQLLTHAGVTLIKYRFYANQDLSLTMEYDLSSVGVRIMLSNHLFHRINHHSFYLQQGQYTWLEMPVTFVEMQLQRKQSYEFIDILLSTDIAAPSEQDTSDHLLTARQLTTYTHQNKQPPDFLDYLSHDKLQDVFRNPADLRQVLHLLQDINALAKRNRLRRPVTDHQLERLFSIKQLIRHQVAENPHLHDWAENSGMNITYFKELFKHVFAITPYRYLLYERIRAAKQLMQSHPEMQLADVAMACGFSDYNNLRRAFVTVENTTLSQWKKITGLSGVWLLLLAGEIF